MKFFLTSSPFLPKSGKMNRANGFRRRLLAASADCHKGLFIASDPSNHEHNLFFLSDFRNMLQSGGVFLDSYAILDDTTKAYTAKLVAESDFIILAGGHVPTQNAFFQKVGLKDALIGFDGVILAISAGSMNSAAEVYAQPEEPGEALDPDYQRFLPGLGLTDVSILPHYQWIRGQELDGLRIFEDITYPDSMGRLFHVMPDGTYLYGNGRRQTIYGECFTVRDGVMEKLCENGRFVNI